MNFPLLEEQFEITQGTLLDKQEFAFSFSKSDSFTRLLDGGARKGELIELFGPEISINTELCIDLLSSIVLTSPTHSVLYIHTGKTHFLDKLMDIFKNHIKNEDDQTMANSLFSRFRILEIFDWTSLMDELHEIYNRTKPSETSDYQGGVPLSQYSQSPSYESSGQAIPNSQIVCIVIDSINPLIGPYVGYKNQEVPIYTLRVLRMLAKQLSISIVTTNYTSSSFDTEQLVKQIKPGLGKIWLNAPHIRIQVELLEDDSGYIPKKYQTIHSEQSGDKHEVINKRKIIRLTIVKSHRNAIGLSINLTIDADGKIS